MQRKIAARWKQQQSQTAKKIWELTVGENPQQLTVGENPQQLTPLKNGDVGDESQQQVTFGPKKRRVITACWKQSPTAAESDSRKKSGS